MNMRRWRWFSKDIEHLPTATMAVERLSPRPLHRPYRDVGQQALSAIN
jgi:hypothetical protein